MRIAHVGSKGIPSGGGTEQVVEALAIRQARAGHLVTVYGSANLVATGWHEGVRSIAIDAGRRRHLGPVILATKAASHAVMHASYDVVHVHGFEHAFLLPLLRLRYPVVLTFHGRGPVGKWGKLAWTVIHAMEPLAVHGATSVTAVSAADAVDLSRRYRGDVRHVRNGIDVGSRVDHAGARALLGRCDIDAEDAFWLFAAARVVPTKGCHLLLEAYRELEDVPPLVVVGDLDHTPEYGHRLRAAAKGRAVRFLPFVEDRPTLLGLLASATAFLFPSESEGMSMMLLEAMAHGGPVLASDIPANRDIVGEAGELVPVGSHEQWARALAALRDGPRDALADARLTGYHRVDKFFSWDRVVAEYEAVYVAALANRQIPGDPSLVGSRHA
jgi:glycosyltransferase involved in cell wall biosynthesis